MTPPLPASRQSWVLADGRLPVVKVHQLKTLYPWMTDVLEGRKTFEVRRDDRGFAVGNLLRLRGWDGTDYTGEEAMREVTYVLRGGGFGIEDGYVVLGLRPAGLDVSHA